MLRELSANCEPSSVMRNSGLPPGLGLAIAYR